MSAVLQDAPLDVPCDGERLLAGLHPIAERRLFCLYKLEANPARRDKPRKVPYLAGGRRLSGSYSDPELPKSLMTLREALALRDKQGAQFGVGVVFTPGCGVTALDFDHVIGPDGKWHFTPQQSSALGAVKPHAFLEVSLSGTGVHAIFLADTTTIKANGVLEQFGDRNFLALTGTQGRGTARPVDAEVVARVKAEVESARDEMNGTSSGAVLAPQPVEPVPVRDRLAVNNDVLQAPVGNEDPARVRSALFHLPADCDYERWRNLGWAVKAALGEAGFAIFDEWSQSSPESYEPGAVSRLWKSDAERVGGIGAATLFKLAIDAGWKPPSAAVPVLAASITEGVSQVESAENSDAHPTDLWLGRVFVQWFGDEFRFDHAAKAWMTFQSGAWTRCGKGEQQEAFKRLSGRLLGRAGTVQESGNDSGAKKLIACAIRAQSAHGIEAALKLAASDPKLAVRSDEFDRDPDWLNVLNGVIHLPTGELHPHDPAQMLSRRSPIAYDVSAGCPRFDRFLAEITLDRADLIENLQRICGYTLSGHVSAEKLFFMLGVGANGKSVFANVMRHILGTYAVVVPSAFLMRSQRDGGGATPELAMVAGARLVLANEVEAGAMLSAQMVKVAVSTEAITARALYGAPFTFAPTHKLWVRGNHKPIIRDNDEGIWRRIDLIPFDRNFTAAERDESLEEQLMAEAPGILVWMVRGFAKWRRDGLRPAECVKDASKVYRADSDLLGQWVNDRCEGDPGGRVDQQQAYRSYRFWCGDQGVHPTSKHSFTRGLKEHGFGEARSGGGTRQKVYTGLRLTP